jgi:N-acyl-phosphatidylethanolamine-hydrolysing phospholipase D
MRRAPHLIRRVLTKNSLPKTFLNLTHFSTMTKCSQTTKVTDDKSQTPGHHGPDGTFQYPDHWGGVKHKKREFSSMAKLMYTFATTKLEVPSQTELPLRQIDWNAINNPDPTIIQYTWIGHSTFLVQLGGFNILTDPVFSDRASITQWMGPRRFREVPCTVDQLPPIDIVVVSHNHYDHLDYYAIKQLFEQHENCTFYAPLKLGNWFSDNFKGINVRDLDWFDTVEHDIKPVRNLPRKQDRAQPVSGTVEVTCLPAQHWSLRNGRDLNQVLWGSFGLKYTPSDNSHPPRVIYHAGDTGYNNICFNEIGKRYSQPNGGIDFAMIPIGAYEPRWFMQLEHVNPEEAVQIALEIDAKHAVGMHWGTFQLTTEPIMEPKQKLKENLAERKLDEFFVTMDHGETRVFKPKSKL